MVVPGRSHSGNIRAHGPDDPLAEHDEPQGDAQAPVQGDQQRGVDVRLVNYPFL